MQVDECVDCVVAAFRPKLLLTLPMPRGRVCLDEQDLLRIYFIFCTMMKFDSVFLANIQDVRMEIRYDTHCEHTQSGTDNHLSGISSVFAGVIEY